jgi:hypothetical protein
MSTYHAGKPFWDLFVTALCPISGTCLLLLWNCWYRVDLSLLWIRFLLAPSFHLALGTHTFCNVGINPTSLMIELGGFTIGFCNTKLAKCSFLFVVLVTGETVENTPMILEGARPLDAIRRRPTMFPHLKWDSQIWKHGIAQMTDGVDNLQGGGLTLQLEVCCLLDVTTVRL